MKAHHWWLIAAVCFGGNALLQTWNLGYRTAEQECTQNDN